MASTVPHSLRQARDNTIMDLQTQLKEVLRENDLLTEGRGGQGEQVKFLDEQYQDLLEPGAEEGERARGRMKLPKSPLEGAVQSSAGGEPG